MVKRRQNNAFVGVLGACFAEILKPTVSCYACTPVVQAMCFARVHKMWASST